MTATAREPRSESTASRDSQFDVRRLTSSGSPFGVAIRVIKHPGIMAVVIPFGIVVFKVLYISRGSSAVITSLLGDLDATSVILSVLIATAPSMVLPLTAIAILIVNLDIRFMKYVRSEVISDHDAAHVDEYLRRVRLFKALLLGILCVFIPFSSVGAMISTLVAYLVGYAASRVALRASGVHHADRVERLLSRVRSDARNGRLDAVALGEIAAEIDGIMANQQKSSARMQILDSRGPAGQALVTAFGILTALLVAVSVLSAPALPVEAIKEKGGPTRVAVVLEDAAGIVVVWYQDGTEVKRISAKEIESRSTCEARAPWAFRPIIAVRSMPTTSQCPNYP